ncbi:MAG: S-layer homology domain-containing protein [Oscillospiraceae bacterium]|nr:S-layer homology domain-containing protein [Oscillospiraceae bacterium]
MKHCRCKRIMALLLALMLSAGMAPCAFAEDYSLESYSDVKRNAWYVPGVRYCLEHGLMTGYGSYIKLFAPDSPVTRAQVATILWRLEGAPVTGLSMHYTDVPEGVWYEDAARWALSADMMGGTAATTFSPDDPITREQLAAILWRYAQYLNGGYMPVVSDASYWNFRDSDKVSDYAAEAMEWAYALGIITGQRDQTGEDLLVPWGTSSRAVTATILMRFCLDMGIDG